MTDPTKCGHEPKVGEVVLYEHVRYPYNPEWPLQRVDAGLFCSNGCLADYINKKVEAEVLTASGKP